MNTIKGPAIFLAQFISDTEPFESLENICHWASDLGYKAIQIPTWEPRIINLQKASESKTYCDELKGTIQSFGLEISELSSHLQGQLVAVHPAYDLLFDAFAPKSLHGNPKARTAWAIDQLKMTAIASHNLGLTSQVSFSGALLWPMIYPWPQRPEGLVHSGFNALADRWLPILNIHEEYGIDLCFEIHPGEDLHDGHSFDLFLKACNMHPRVCINYDPSHFLLQQLDYLSFIDIYHERIKAFHVKDAEFNPSGKSGVYGGYQNWMDRAGRFRSLGDGQVDFKNIFSKLTQYGYSGWAVLEWECCIKSQDQGAREGAEFISKHIINPANKVFDDFASGDLNVSQINKILGL